LQSQQQLDIQTKKKLEYTIMLRYNTYQNNLKNTKGSMLRTLSICSIGLCVMCIVLCKQRQDSSLDWTGIIGRIFHSRPDIRQHLLRQELARSATLCLACSALFWMYLLS